MAVQDPPSQPKPALSDVLGRVEGVDLEIGLYGWAYKAHDKSALVEVELWAGPVRIAVTEANLFRSDLGSQGDPELNPGFVFGVSALRTASLNLAVEPDAALEVRVKGGDPLLSAEPLTFATLSERLEDHGLPPAETSYLDLGAALATLTRQARLLRKPPLRPVANANRGQLEHVAVIDRNAIAIAGWIHKDAALEQAAILLDGEKYEAAFSLAAYDRADLPDYAQAFIGVMQTTWRPRPKGSEPFLFFGEHAEHHLRGSPALKIEKLQQFETWLERIPTFGGHPRLLELRQRLLANEGWSVRSDGGAGMGVALSIDRAVLAPGFGAIIDGWVLSGPRRLAGMALRLGSTVLDLDPGSLRRRPRSDLAKAYPMLKDGAPTAGFVGLFTGPLHEGDLLDPMFRVQFSDGASVSVALNAGAFLRLDAGFDADLLRQMLPSLRMEPRFPQLAAARSELLKRSLSGSAHSVQRASADRILILTLPVSDHDLMLVLEGAARNIGRVPPGTAVALVGQSNQNRDRILSWLAELNRMGAEAGVAVSFTLVEAVGHALYACDALLRAHKASVFAFVGPHVWLMDEGWQRIVQALWAPANSAQADAGPAYLPVAEPGRENGPGQADAELFVWTEAAFRNWLGSAPVSFDTGSSDRGLPSADVAGPAAGVRLNPAGRNLYEASLDQAVLLSYRLST